MLCEAPVTYTHRFQQLGRLKWTKQEHWILFQKKCWVPLLMRNSKRKKKKKVRSKMLIKVWPHYKDILYLNWCFLPLYPPRRLQQSTPTKDSPGVWPPWSYWALRLYQWSRTCLFGSPMPAPKELSDSAHDAPTQWFAYFLHLSLISRPS